MYCARSVRYPAVVTYCESYVHVPVAVVEISSWRLRWRNPGTSSGVMWMDIGRRFWRQWSLWHNEVHSCSRSCVCNKMWEVIDLWSSWLRQCHLLWMSHIPAATVNRSYVGYVLKPKKQLSTDPSDRLNLLLVCMYLVTLRHMTDTWLFDH